MASPLTSITAGLSIQDQPDPVLHTAEVQIKFHSMFCVNNMDVLCLSMVYCKTTVQIQQKVTSKPSLFHFFMNLRIGETNFLTNELALKV